MSTIALVSAKGAPGVSTLALAMALAAPDAVLVEVDAAGGDLALRFGVAQSPGLAELAARAKRPDGETTPAFIRPLASGALHAVPAPVDARGVCAALEVLATAPELLSRIAHDRQVVLDFGRAVVDGPGWALLESCDVALLVTRGDLPGLGHAQTLAGRLREGTPRSAFVLVDTGPYPRAEAEDALGLPCAGVIAFHPRQAARLADPGALDRAASSPLARAARDLFTRWSTPVLKEAAIA